MSQNLKFLRKSKGYTQAEMQAHTGVSGATWSNYEKGGTEPDINTILRICKFFRVHSDDLFQGNFEKGNLISKKWDPEIIKKGKLKGKGMGNLIEKKYPKSGISSIVEDPEEVGITRHLMPQVITVDSQGDENVILVPVRARAGYLNGYADPEFVQKLPAYRLPGLSNGTFRLFEVDGLSMYPTLSGGDLAICSNVEQLGFVRDDRVHVVVTKNEGVVVKRVLNRLKTDGKLILKSDNYKDRDLYPPIVCDPADVLEIWYATGYISKQMRPPAEMYNRLIDLEGRFTLLEDIVKKSKK